MLIFQLEEYLCSELMSESAMDLKTSVSEIDITRIIILLSFLVQYAVFRNKFLNNRTLLRIKEYECHIYELKYRKCSALLIR